MTSQAGPQPFPWAFFLGAYAFTWLILLPAFLVPGLPGQALVPIAQFGPSLTAFVLVFRSDGWRGARGLAARAVDFRIPIRWVAVILLLPSALAAAAYYANAALGNPPPATPMLDRPALIIANFFLILFLQGPVPEEFGWRGYALDRLQSRWPAATAAIVLGAIWGVWHLPAFFLPGVSQSYMPLWAFLVLTVALSVLIAWIYNSTGHNLLAAMLFHAVVNLTAFGVFPAMDLTAGASPSGFLLLTALYVLAAAVVVLGWGYRRLERGGGAPSARPASSPA